MDGFKNFLLRHGEKLAMAVVAPLCAWSLFSASGGLNKSKLQIPPSGEAYEVNVGRIENNLEKVRQNLAGREPSQSLPPAPSSLADLLGRKPHGIQAASTQWVLYSQPPPVEGVVFESVQRSTMDPPSQFITKVAPPVNIELRAGLGCVLVTAFDPPRGQVSWPLDGQVDVLVQRLAVSEAREDVPVAVLETMRQAWSAKQSRTGRPPDGPGVADLEQAAQQGRALFVPSLSPEGGDDPFGAEAGPAHVRTAPGTAARDPWAIMGGGSGAGSAAAGGGGDENTMSMAQQELLSGMLDLDAGLGLNTVYQMDFATDDVVRSQAVYLADPSTRSLQGWVTVGYMTPYVRRLTDEQCMTALREGKLPEERRVSPSGAAQAPEPAMPEPPSRPAPAAADPQEGDEADDPFDLPAPEAPAPSAAPGAPMPPGVLSDFANLTEDIYVPRPRALLDTGLQANTLYRYRLVLVARPRPLPESVRGQREYRDYITRVEWGDVVRREGVRDGALHPTTTITSDPYLAPSRSAWERFQREAEARPVRPLQYASHLAARGGRVPFPVLDPVKMDWDPRTGRISTLVRQDGNLTALAQEYAAGERSYSRPVHTSLVLTPMTRRLLLTGMSPSPEANAQQAHFKIELFEPGGSQTSMVYKVTAPPEVSSLSTQSWVKTDDRGNPLPGPDGKAQVRTLAEYYGELSLLRPRPIGGAETRPARRNQPEREFDFSSGWGLVDIRTGQTIRYTAGRDGKDRVAPRDMRYVVVCELNVPEGQEPRYKRLNMEKLPVARDEERTEVVWDPDLPRYLEQVNDRLAEEARQRASEQAAQNAGPDLPDFQSPLADPGPDAPDMTPDFDDFLDDLSGDGPGGGPDGGIAD